MKNWKFIKEINWSFDNSDYKYLRSELKKKISRDEMLELRSFIDRKRKLLELVLCDHSIDKINKPYGYYGVGDDGFWDLTAHIVGLGKEEFTKNLHNPELAKSRADEGDYVENFQYILLD